MKAGEFDQKLSALTMAELGIIERNIEGLSIAGQDGILVKDRVPVKHVAKKHRGARKVGGGREASGETGKGGVWPFCSAGMREAPSSQGGV